MTLPREPRIHPVSIAALRPTQITVGMREVKTKRKSWRDHPDRKKADFLGKHLIPVVWGPKDEYYVIESTNPKVHGYDGAVRSFVEYLAELATSG